MPAFAHGKLGSFDGDALIIAPEPPADLLGRLFVVVMLFLFATLARGHVFRRDLRQFRRGEVDNGTVARLIGGCGGTSG